jgi:hypothetical protein
MDRRATLELEALHEIGTVLWRGGDIDKSFRSSEPIVRAARSMQD